MKINLETILEQAWAEAEIKAKMFLVETLLNLVINFCNAVKTQTESLFLICYYIYHCRPKTRKRTRKRTKGTQESVI